MRTDEDVPSTPLRVHLAFVSAVVAMLVVIATFLGSFPLECQKGQVLVSTWLTQFCSKK